MALFKLNVGVVPACDVTSLEDLKKIVDNVDDVEGIVGYKVGKRLMSRFGLPNLMVAASSSTDKPIILDVQKEGNDVEFTEEAFISDYAEDGVKSLILFPFSGPRVQAKCIKACHDNKITPIGGFRLTQPGFDASEEVDVGDILPNLKGVKFNGYLSPEAEENALKMYCLSGVEYFIGPGNKPDDLRRQKGIIQKFGRNPKFLLPGIKAQGGDITTAFNVIKECPGKYAIVGRGIIKAPDMKEAAKVYCGEALSFG